MAAIFAQMDGDAVRAGGDGDAGGVQRVWVGFATGIAQRGDVIDIYPQA